MLVFFPELKAKIMSYSRGWQIFFIEGQIAKSLETVGHMFSVATSQFYLAAGKQPQAECKEGT